MSIVLWYQFGRGDRQHEDKEKDGQDGQIF